MSFSLSMSVLSIIVLAAPAAALLLLGAWYVVGRKPSERVVVVAVASAQVVALVAAVSTALGYALSARGAFIVDLGRWFSTADYSLRYTLVLDLYSLTMLMLTTVVCALIGHFSYRYLHQEAGYQRFFVLLLLFQAGMTLLVLSGSLDTLFVGWELVGLTSALLIAFHHERSSTVRNALRAFATYRVCDLGLLGAVLLLHHFLAGAGHSPPGAAPSHWPLDAGGLLDHQITLVALLLLMGAIGKSAQLPASPWLPRAMEGPTPSSALFYGALSVHAGVYLLLRAEPLLRASSVAAGAVIVVGATSALVATLVGRAQTDVKNALAYATICQVGLIFVEVGVGVPRLALVHVVGHASVRLMQLLRSPSVLHDRHLLDAAAGGRPLHRPGFERLLPQWLQSRLYALSLERFHVETLVERLVVSPVMGLAAALARLSARVTGQERRQPFADAADAADAVDEGVTVDVAAHDEERAAKQVQG